MMTTLLHIQQKHSNKGIPVKSCFFSGQYSLNFKLLYGPPTRDKKKKISWCFAFFVLPFRTGKVVKLGLSWLVLWKWGAYVAGQ